MTARTKRWVSRLHLLAIALLIGALFTVPVTVRADGDPPATQGPFIDYQQVELTVAETWPVVPGGLLVLRITVDDLGSPPPGHLIVKPVWPRSEADTVSPGAARTTGTMTKFFPTYQGGEAWIVMPIPDDILSDGAPSTIGVEVDFAALVDRGRSMPALFYWGHLDHEQPIRVPGAP